MGAGYTNPFNFSAGPASVCAQIYLQTHLISFYFSKSLCLSKINMILAASQGLGVIGTTTLLLQLNQYLSYKYFKNRLSFLPVSVNVRTHAEVVISLLKGTSCSNNEDLHLRFNLS